MRRDSWVLPGTGRAESSLVTFTEDQREIEALYVNGSLLPMPTKIEATSTPEDDDDDLLHFVTPWFRRRRNSLVVTYEITDTITFQRVPEVLPTAAVLTPRERSLTKALGHCFTEFGKIAKATGLNDDDVAEFAARVHDLQHAVMAQAARRAHPEMYR